MLPAYDDNNFWGSDLVFYTFWYCTSFFISMPVLWGLISGHILSNKRDIAMFRVDLYLAFTIATLLLKKLMVRVYWIKYYADRDKCTPCFNNKQKIWQCFTWNVISSSLFCLIIESCRQSYEVVIVKQILNSKYSDMLYYGNYNNNIVICR